MFKFAKSVGAFLMIGALVGVVTASSSERYIGNAVHKDYPGMCFYSETQTPIKIGKTYRPTNECVEIYCREDFVLHLRFCPRYMVGDHCKVTFNRDAVYPGCCAQIDCPRRNNEV